MPLCYATTLTLTLINAYTVGSPLPYNRRHLSYHAYLEVIREDYQNCSLLSMYDDCA